mgnify:FL=1
MIIKGESTILDNDDFQWIQKSDSTDIVNEVCGIIRANSSYQVLVPVHKHLVGTLNLNSQIQQIVNPTGDLIRNTHFRINDKIIYTQNDYHNGIMNGEIGIILGYEKEQKKIHIQFDSQNSIKVIPDSATENLQLAYAISIHKSQGSEFDNVIIALHSSHGLMLQRNLLYTAITRAKKKCVLIGSVVAVRIATQRKPPQRRTRLFSYLKNYDLTRDNKNALRH